MFGQWGKCHCSSVAECPPPSGELFVFVIGSEWVWRPTGSTTGRAHASITQPRPVSVRLQACWLKGRFTVLLLLKVFWIVGCQVNKVSPTVIRHWGAELESLHELLLRNWNNCWSVLDLNGLVAWTGLLWLSRMCATSKLNVFYENTCTVLVVGNSSSVCSHRNHLKALHIVRLGPREQHWASEEGKNSL